MEHSQGPKNIAIHKMYLFRYFMYYFIKYTLQKIGISEKVSLLIKSAIIWSKTVKLWNIL